MKDSAPNSMSRRILHVDMDAFFAAVELQRHPELRGIPLIVGGHGDPRERGVVAAASYEARRFGVRSAMPLRTAYRRCPGAIFLPVDYETYSAVSGKIKRTLQTFSPIMEDAGIDEAFLDITDVAGESKSIALTIKQRIADETGLTCSIGVAPNKLLAKLASEINKPDGLTVITEQDVEKRIFPLPVGKLWGVGPKSEKKLAGLRVKTIGDLARTPKEVLLEHFGEAHGAYLARAARGIDETPLITHWEPASASHQTTFQHDTSDWLLIRHSLIKLTRELVADLSLEGRVGRTVTVTLRYADFDKHSHSVTLPVPTRDGEMIEVAALECLSRFTLVKKVRLVGVRVGGLLRQREST